MLLIHHSGKMQLLLSGLLLASHCTISSWSVSSGKLIVTQSPDVSVLEGNSVSITCCPEGSFERVRLEWRKNQTILDPGTFMSNGSCRNLDFPNITREDSGRYVCKGVVDIPFYEEKEGNGTFINVTLQDNKNNTTSEVHNSYLLLVIPLAIVVLLLLITLICLYNRWLNQERATRVIYEVPHTDSEVDKQSTNSSTGSSQWCQVPLYDSYFERVEVDDSTVKEHQPRKSTKI